MKPYTFHIPFKCLLIILVLIFSHQLQAQLEVLYENTDQVGFFRHLKEDYQGNILAQGYLNSDMTLDPITLAMSDGKLFIAKYDPSSGNWTWANQLSGTISTEDLSVDGSGNVLITGFYSGVVTFDNITLTSTKFKQGNNWYHTYDMYVAKTDVNGNFLWAKSFGSNVGEDRGYAVCTDASGNCYVTGYYSSKSGNCQKGDVYVVKLNPSGSTVWQKRITPSSCSGWGTGNDITVDATGNVYFTGQFNGTFPFGTGMSVSSTTYDVFTSKLNSSGTALWVKTGSGPGIDFGSRIYMDAAGDVYVGGEYSEHECCSETITFGSTTLPATTGDSDAFVIKYTNSGTQSWLLHACTFTSYGVVAGLIPHEGDLIVCLDNLGLKTIDPANGDVLDFVTITGNLEGLPAPPLYKFRLIDFEPSASGYIMIGEQFCDTVGMANLSFTHTTCMDCDNWWDCGTDYTIIRSIEQMQQFTNPIQVNNIAANVFEQLGFDVFPNPAEDEITITMLPSEFPVELTIHDQMGNELYRMETPKGQQSVSISLDHRKFPSGIYYVSAVSGDDISAKKIVILR